MLIRYHAQRKHIIFSLDTLLYELHALSFLLAPSVFILLCRCATQFQFARVRDLDGRRSLAFWLALVLLVNASGVWTHAVAPYGGGAGDGQGEKGVVLDFVGMGHRPAKIQLLLLDATIMFLQALLTTISYETSLTLVMDVPDPLLSAPSTSITEPSEETAPFLPYSFPDTSSASPASSSITYPPTPTHPMPSSTSSNEEPPFGAKAPVDPLPPPIPIIDLTFRHFLHRLTSPMPEMPVRANEGLDAQDDELAVLRLPLPNTTSVRVAHTLRMLAQARQRQRQRERQESRRLRRPDSASDASGRGRGSGTERDRDGENEEDESSRDGRIPGAMDEE